VRRKGRTVPGGKQAMELMARSRGHAIGVTQISEILSVQEVVLVGPYPPPLQKTTTYSGVVPACAAAGGGREVPALPHEPCGAGAIPQSGIRGDVRPERDRPLSSERARPSSSYEHSRPH